MKLPASRAWVALCVFATAVACGRAPAYPPPLEGTYEVRSVSLTLNGEAVAADIAAIGGGFFPSTQVEPALGRPFTADEYQEGSTPVVVLRYELWEAALAGDPNVLGTDVNVDGTPHRVVGIMPSGYDAPGEVQAWIPR